MEMMRWLDGRKTLRRVTLAAVLALSSESCGFMEDKPGQEGTAACEEDALESFATANSDLQEEVTDPGLVRQRAREAVSQLCLDINSFPGMEVRVFLTSSDCEAIDGNPVVELNGTYFPIEGGLGETVIQETLPVGQLDPLGPLDVRFCNDAEQG